MTKTITHKPKGNKFSYMKAILLAMSLILIVNCSNNDNNTPAKDTTAPTVSSGMTADAMTITLTVSESVSAAEDVAGGDFTIAGVATPTTVSTVEVSGTTITLMLSAEMTDSDTPTITYVPGDNRIADAAGNELAGFDTSPNITNTLDTTAPTVSSGITVLTTSITLTVSETVSAAMAVAGGDFTIDGVATNPMVSAVEVSGTTITLTLSAAMTHSDTPHVSYTVDDSSIKVKDAADNELTSFNQSITNNLMPPSRLTADTGGPAGATVVFVTPPASAPTVTTPTYPARATYTAPDATDMATNLDREDYTTVATSATIAQAVTAIQADTEYMAGGGADQIHAAYAYARGYTGDGIVISNMGSKLSSGLSLFARKVVFSTSGSRNYDRGYVADGSFGGHDAGVCDYTDDSDVPTCTAEHNHGTHLAGIIVGIKETVGIQGIAYNAQIKPIDIVSGDVSPEEFNLAIAAASGMTINGAGMSPITVMNNGWDKSGVGRHTDSSTPTFYKTANKVSTISNEEAAAWREAVKTTVVVFGAGDYGHNSENGMVKLYTDDTFDTAHTTAEKAWSAIDGADENRASSHARLPLEITELQGMWLTVIALDENDRIWEESNGCGDTLSFCIGAPGVAINSLFAIGGAAADSGTAQAAAHVTGAIAVLKEAFPSLSPTQLVHRILDTADDLGIAGVDEVYGHGVLNLAKATEPDSTAPTLSSAKTANAVSITLEMSEFVYGTDITAGDFTIAGVTPAPTVFAVANVSGRTIKLILSAPITGSDTLTVSYTAGTPSITDAFGNTLGNFGPQTITNTL